MQTYSLAAAMMVTGASSAAADRLCFDFVTLNGTDWTLTAELHNPESTVLATIADLGFTMTGVNIANFAYNPAFDSDFFGDASVTATSSQIDFLGGNTLPPLNNAGGVDSSNPLHIATFTADSIDGFDLVGQVTGAYTGVPFPIILTYQNADGSAGDTPWGFGFTCLPSPSTAALLGLGGVVAARRRR